MVRVPTSRPEYNRELARWLATPQPLKHIIGMEYTSLIHANPDVSGIGIIITFYAQGALNLVLFYYSWALKHSPSEQTKSEWIDTLLQEFVIGSTAAGYALCIAAFSQWNTITTYHLFLCYSFLSALSTVGWHSRGLIFSPRKPSDRILGFYFFGNQLLSVAMNCVTIYRLNSVWDDTGGNCFIVWVDGDGRPEERDDAVLWLYVDLIWGLLSQLVPSLVVWSGRSEFWAPQNPKAKLILIILFARIPLAFFFFWNMHWTIKLTLSNRRLIDDNEYDWGFGQVGALVALCLSVCRGLISYQEHKRQQVTPKQQHATPDDNQRNNANLV